MKLFHVPARYVLALMGFWGTFTQILFKQNISVAIIEMVDFAGLENFSTSTQNSTLTSDTNWTTQQNLLEIPECPDMGAEADSNRTSLKDEFKFLWTGSQQGLVLGSYSYGVVVSLVAMTSLSRKVGHVRLLGYCIFATSILTILTPVVTEAGGYIALVVLRACCGILSGHTISQLFGLAGIWSPPQERSKIVSFMLAGAPIGQSCFMPVAGVLAGSLGWKSVFYVTGGCGVCWSILWLILIHETPEKHPRILDSEKRYITSSLSHRQQSTEKRNIPWLKMLKSRPLYCLVAVHFCSVYGRTTFRLLLPTYLRTALKFDVKTSGILSAVPFALAGLLLFVCGPLADYFILKGIRPIIVRKIFTGFGMVLSCVAVVILIYSGCNVVQVISMVTITIAMDSFAVPGFKSCLIEISPEFSGIIFGMSATIANCSGILAPQITGVLRDAYGYFGWQIAFWIAAAAYLFGGLEFCIFGTNERQVWKKPNNHQSSVMTLTENI
uniref:sialin-like n=1 Tax=Styela clava TaxID=7725 RepID=UPI001939DF97|nr:sialin-like [Styela clava]